MINTTKRRMLAGLLGFTLFASACGGSAATAVADAIAASEASSESSQDSAPAVDPESASGDVTRWPGHEGIELVSELIPELADLPMPDVAAFHYGSAYTARQDPRETAIQRVDFLLEPAEVAMFFVEQLTAQGYTITNGSVDTAEAKIAETTEAGFASFQLSFEGPDGVPLNLSIDPANTGGNTTMNINRYRAGHG